MEESWPVCRKCFEPVKREGLFAKLIRLFATPVKKTSSSVVVPLGTHVRQTFKIRDPQTGEMREYHSLEELPPEHQERMRELVEMAKKEGGTQEISLSSLTGETKTYHSVSEMPPEIRALYEKAMGGKRDEGAGPSGGKQ
jgi:hypothetical protein